MAKKSDDESPGWHAIDDALRPIYGDREPYHVGTIVSWAMGGPDPIHGISAYKNDKPVPHWHYVTYGFTELWDKESTNKEVSGYGFELTFRCARSTTEKKPPNWAFNFLQNLGRYVFETGNCFGVGHTMPLNGPIAVDADTLIHAISFIDDIQLPPINTPNGEVEFLQIVGLTMDELEAISSWNARAFLELRRESDELLITDLDRRSWLKDKTFAKEVAKRTKEDGSSCGWLALVLECETNKTPVRVKIQTIAVEGFKRRLLGRLPYGRELVLSDKEATAVFKPAKKSQMKLVEDAVTISLSDEDLQVFTSGLEPHAGVHNIPGIRDLIVEIVRTEITDGDGNVVEIVE